MISTSLNTHPCCQPVPPMAVPSLCKYSYHLPNQNTLDHNTHGCALPAQIFSWHFHFLSRTTHLAITPMAVPSLKKYSVDFFIFQAVWNMAITPMAMPSLYKYSFHSPSHKTRNTHGRALPVKLLGLHISSHHQVACYGLWYHIQLLIFVSLLVTNITTMLHSCSTATSTKSFLCQKTCV